VGSNGEIGAFINLRINSRAPTGSARGGYPKLASRWGAAKQKPQIQAARSRDFSGSFDRCGEIDRCGEVRR